ncbi:MAG TPA: hypothetical protein VIO94_09995 [Phenylobacterium sp.]
MIQETASGGFARTAETLAKGSTVSWSLWEVGMRSWANYISDLAVAKSPVAVVEANARYLADCMEGCGLAAGELQREAGLVAPTLSDS